MKIRIKDLKIKFHGKLVPLSDHIYYQAVAQNDRKMFEEYVKGQSFIQKNKQSGTWSGIQSLKKSLDKGFRVGGTDITIRGTRCRHGRHRMCLLALLYPKAELITKDDRLLDFISHRK